MSERAGPPYHLHYWGGVQNDRWIERDLGITATDFWFDTKKERKEFAAKLRAVADAHGQIIAFAEHEGPQCKKRTVARMRMRLADGRVFSLSYNFGFGYDEDSARYMFFRGNYDCDCNRSIFLEKAHEELSGMPELDCGQSITMDEFDVEFIDDDGGNIDIGVMR